MNYTHHPRSRFERRMQRRRARQTDRVRSRKRLFPAAIRLPGSRPARRATRQGWRYLVHRLTTRPAQVR
jgi:hypothetical protein